MKLSGKPGIGKKVGILGVPLGYGASQTGNELGAEAMRLSNIRGKRLIGHIRELGYEVTDLGDVEIVVPDRAVQVGENPKYLPEMLESCRRIAASLKDILDKNIIPVILGGDHSIAIGTMSGISSHFR